MKTLAVLLVSIAAVAMSNGLVVNKCELKQQLQAVLMLPANATDILAKIVCQVEQTSNFSTSAVNTVPEPQEPKDQQGSRERRDTKGGGKNKGRPGSKVTPPKPTKKPKVWTLYGLFQLSDHVACTSSQVPSHNLCQISCDKLIDSDISDDLSCVKTLLTQMSGVSGHESGELLQKMMSLTKPQCFVAVNSVYFADCAA